MRILVAFDKFKDALSAPDACVLALAECNHLGTVTTCPLADGGEGFSTILTRATEGSWHHAVATGARGISAESGFGLVELGRIPQSARRRLDFRAGPIAVIEMASASGLESLAANERDPWLTHSTGTGELIKAAVATGARGILLGVGGSATNDLGLGALSALGWQALDAAGQLVLPLCPANWSAITRLVPPTNSNLPPIRIACDVSNPLLGPRGATAVFGPQKGLRPDDFPRLESEMTRMAALLGSASHRPGLESTPGAGAAGGMAFGLLTAADAQLVPGFDLVEDWLDLAAKVDAADLIVTGEGGFDESSLEGKGPGSLLRRAVAAGKAVWVLAGRVDLESPPAGAVVRAITPPGTPLPEALAQTGENLTRTLRELLKESSLTSDS